MLLQSTPRRITTSSLTPPLTGDPSPRPPGPPAEVRLTTVLTKPFFSYHLSWDSSNVQCTNENPDDLISNTNQRDQRTYKNFNQKKTAWEMSWKNVLKCKKNYALGFGTWNKFYFKNKRTSWQHFTEHDIAQSVPRTPHAGSRHPRDAGPCRRAARPHPEPGDLVSIPSTVVCALMLSYLNCGDQKLELLTTLRPLLVQLLSWFDSKSTRFYILFVNMSSVNNQVYLSSNCVILY